MVWTTSWLNSKDSHAANTTLLHIVYCRIRSTLQFCKSIYLQKRNFTRQFTCRRSCSHARLTSFALSRWFSSVIEAILSFRVTYSVFGSLSLSGAMTNALLTSSLMGLSIFGGSCCTLSASILRKLNSTVLKSESIRETYHFITTHIICTCMNVYKMTLHKKSFSFSTKNMLNNSGLVVWCCQGLLYWYISV